jgi:hypothetical protein
LIHEGHEISQRILRVSLRPSWTEDFMTDNTFQLSGFAFPSGKADPFGMWEVVPATSGVSFSVGAVAEPEEPIHRVSFASPKEGLALLDVRQRELAGQQQTLMRLEERLAQIAPSGGGVSFAAPSEVAPEFIAPEAELEAAIRRMSEPVSYGLFDRKKQAEQEADLESTSQWRKFLDQVRDMVVNYARVQTEVAGLPIGQTAVDWTGDFHTIWTPVATSADMMLHYHNITATLQWRLGTMRLVGVVSAGAANIAVKLGVPGGQLLALPAVWNFVKDVLAEWRKLQAIKQQ